MKLVTAMIWKETHSFCRDRKLIASAAILTLVLPSLLLFTSLRSSLEASASLFTSSVLVTAFLSYLVTWRTFSNERDEHSLPSLLASPITVLEMFVGKSLAVFLFMYPLLLLAVVIVAVNLLIRTGTYPSAADIVLTLVTVPIWGLLIVEVMGALFLVIGNFEAVRYLAFFLAAAVFSLALGNQEILPNFALILVSTLIGTALASVTPAFFIRVDKAWLLK